MSASATRRPGRRRMYRQLRHPVVHKAPRPCGSKRPLSPGRLEEHAALLVVQASSALRAHRPTAWLALVLHHLEVVRPPGARRADARANAAWVAAALAVSADWRSGRRGRPGRQVSAALLAVAEKTVQRHWALLAGCGLLQLEQPAALLGAAARAEVLLEQDVTAAQRRRWVNRAQWRLVIPDWARELTDEQIWPYVQQAHAMLWDMAHPSVDTGVRRPVDKRPGRFLDRRSVLPSIGFEVLDSLPLRRSSFSRPSPVDRRRTGPPDNRPAKEPTGGATRHSPTRGGSGRPVAPGAVRLARELVADGRLPFARGAQVHRICRVVERLRGWTADDVVAEVHQRLAECRQRMLPTAAAPAKYLSWLLRHAVPGEPPAQIAAAVARTARPAVLDHAAARAGRWEPLWEPDQRSAGAHQARQLVEDLAHRQHQAKVAAARRHAELEARRLGRTSPGDDHGHAR